MSQCIELYTFDNEEQRIGFYALEMAADLELEPKPHHVIAFEILVIAKIFVTSFRITWIC